MIDGIDTTSLPGLHDRALIRLMGYTFAPVGAGLAMRDEEFYVQKRRGWVRLHAKGGKEHEMHAHPNRDTIWRSPSPPQISAGCLVPHAGAAAS